ncbi:hypothetical protein TWF506_010811 [Arthrobotrys conoides]|uniref:Uncharacterized protein n=1 Tax=Arthrobotrys conoides TaxID=74498 RepID=A0AAN8N261_9PEZI
MPRCHKALNRTIHQSIAKQKREISEKLENLKQIKQNSTTWSVEDEKEIEKLRTEITGLSYQSVALYRQFIVSPNRIHRYQYYDISMWKEESCVKFVPLIIKLR